MKEKLLEYFAGGSNHYPFINQWHSITDFIKTYITTNSDWLYFFQILIFGICISIVMFIIIYSIVLIFDIITYVIKILVNERKKRI
jgi:Zn-dependent membrane protease YugP